MRPFWIFFVFCILLFAVNAAQARSFTRGAKGFARDQRRLSTIPRILDLSQVPADRSPFAKKLVEGSSLAWRPYAEGTKPFSVSLDSTTSIQGKVYRYRFPMTSGTKLTELRAVSGDRSVSLMPKTKTPVLMQHAETAFYYDNNHVRWHGPQSKFALLAYFHELGHVQDFGDMTEGQRQEFRQIYDRKSNEQRLTPEQQRKMVGFERSAWTHGLRQVRQLKQQGIDLFKDIPLKDMMRTIYGSMKGYYEYRGNKN